MLVRLNISPEAAPRWPERATASLACRGCYATERRTCLAALHSACGIRRSRKNTVLIADGGLATELEARGHDLSDALWSARLLVDAPQEITAVHTAFFRAGAMIATTASYQASFDSFAASGLSRDDTIRLLRRSVELAKDARDHVGVAGQCAGRVDWPVRRRARRRFGISRTLRA